NARSPSQRVSAAKTASRHLACRIGLPFDAPIRCRLRAIVERPSCRFGSPAFRVLTDSGQKSSESTANTFSRSCVRSLPMVHESPCPAVAIVAASCILGVELALAEAVPDLRDREKLACFRLGTRARGVGACARAETRVRPLIRLARA